MQHCRGGGTHVRWGFKEELSAVHKLERKPKYAGNPSSLPDLLRGLIVVHSLKEVRQVVNCLQSSGVGLAYRVVESDDYFRSPRRCYRSHHLVIRFLACPQFQAEIQIKTPLISRAWEWTHGLYKTMRIQWIVLIVNCLVFTLAWLGDCLHANRGFI